MTKFRKEKYIQQVQSERTGKWTFRVRVNGADVRFNEDDYLSSSQAFKEAIKYRNQLLVNPILAKAYKSDLSVQDIFDEIPSYFSLEDETKRKLEVIFNKYVNCKNKQFDEVKVEDIQSELNQMSYNCSHDCISRVKTIWNKMYKVALVKGIVSSNLSELVELPKSRKVNSVKRNEYIDEETLNTLCELIPNRLTAPLEKYYAPFILKALYFTGMRPQELFALTKNDINLKKRTININKRINSSRNIQRITGTKTEESARVIPFNEKVLPIFKELLKNDSQLLFPNKDGDYYLPSTLSDRYHKIASSVGIDFHFYQCRFSYITRLYRGGVDIKTIQDLVGQKINMTTLGYVVSSEERMKNAVKNF